MNYKNINYKRAEDIILTSNKNFDKFYQIKPGKIIFWISDNPYRKYILTFDLNAPDSSIQLQSYIGELLKENNFKGE